MISKDWFRSATLWVNLLSVAAVAIAMSLQLAGQLALTAQQVAVGTVVLAVVNAAIRVLNTNQPIAGSPAEYRLMSKLIDKRMHD